MQADMLLGQPDEAKKTFAESSARGEPGLEARLLRFQIACYEQDEASMNEQLSWAKGRPAEEPFFLALAADFQKLHGHLANAEQLLRKAAKAGQKRPPVD